MEIHQQFLALSLTLVIAKCDEFHLFLQCGHVKAQPFPHINGKTVVAFYAIPYGATGGRFGLPLALKDSDGIISHSKPKFCPNYYLLSHKFKGSETFTEEECLNLDVYTSGATLTKQLSPVVVVVVFDDPKSDLESALRSYSETVVEIGSTFNVVIVKVNYRNGPLGFLLSKNETKIERNLGLLDQQLALKWVKRNIVAFGGNPDQVLVVGQGIGAVGIGWHLKHSDDLFRNFVLLSATPSNFISNLNLETKLTLHENYINSFSCDEDKRSCLERLPLKQLFLIDQHSPRLPLFYHELFMPNFAWHSFVQLVGEMLYSSKQFLLAYQKWDGVLLHGKFFPSASHLAEFINTTVGRFSLDLISDEFKKSEGIGLWNIGKNSWELNKILTDLFISSSVYEFTSSNYDTANNGFIIEGDFTLIDQKSHKNRLLSTVLFKWPIAKQKLQELFRSREPSNSTVQISATNSTSFLSNFAQIGQLKRQGECQSLTVAAKVKGEIARPTFSGYEKQKCQTALSELWNLLLKKSFAANKSSYVQLCDNRTIMNTSTKTCSISQDEMVEQLVKELQSERSLYQILMCILAAIIALLLPITITSLFCNFPRRQKGRKHSSEETELGDMVTDRGSQSNHQRTSVIDQDSDSEYSKFYQNIYPYIYP